MLQAYRLGRKIGGTAHDRCAQPDSPLANVIVTSLTPSGMSGSGKGGKAFMPPFCREVRRQGYATHFCTSIRQLERFVASSTPAIIIHVYGEDHYLITSPRMKRAESKAHLIFNKSEIGPIIADKQLSLEHFTQFGVPMPPAPTEGIPTFSNDRLGTSTPVSVVDSPMEADQNRYNRAMINTVQTTEGTAYHTSVRLMCVADRIIHIMVRARPTDENNASVHSKDTPLDPKLLGFLQDKLVHPYIKQYQNIARKMCDAIGPCFVAHDVLVDHQGGGVFVCEAGLKFFDNTLQRHLSPIGKDLPFHTVLFNEAEYGRFAGGQFADYVTASVDF